MATQSSTDGLLNKTKEQSSIAEMDSSEFEALLHRVHREAKQTATLDDTNDSVLLAKLACYAIRQLHSERIVRRD